MKIFHLSDLHIGKTLNGYSLQGIQRGVLGQIAKAVGEERPDVILLCGDIYDRTVPAGESYKVFDGFLEELSCISPAVPVLVIAGNHDSPDRLSYAGTFLEKHHIHISVMPPQVPGEYLKKITLYDQYGPVHFYLLPYLKPGYVRGVLEEEPGDYETAVSKVLERESLNKGERNVLLSHQFYVGESREAETCESEQSVLMVGGLDKISSSVLKEFDYAALGHLHGSQQAGSSHIRYSGTPYKYSVSEEHHKKSITVVELEQKGAEPKIGFLPLAGVQDVRSLRGSLGEVLLAATMENRHDFVSVTLTDEEEPYLFREQLEEVYDHLLEVRVDNTRTREKLADVTEEVSAMKPGEAFETFFETVLKRPMDEAERAVMERIIQEEKEERS